MKEVNHGGSRPGAGRPQSVQSEALRTVRLALDKTQEEMARELKCSLSAYTKMEQQKRLPANADVMANFRRLVTASGVEVKELEETQ